MIERGRRKRRWHYVYLAHHCSDEEQLLVRLCLVTGGGPSGCGVTACYHTPCIPGCPETQRHSVRWRLQHLAGSPGQIVDGKVKEGASDLAGGRCSARRRAERAESGDRATCGWRPMPRCPIHVWRRPDLSKAHALLEQPAARCTATGRGNGSSIGSPGSQNRLRHSPAAAQRHTTSCAICN